jgi:hypothetical protein
MDWVILPGSKFPSQWQTQPQIPFGDDNKKSRNDGNGKEQIQGSFTAFRMTVVRG